MEQSKFKEDLLLKATLGENVYNQIKKFVPEWRANYLKQQAECPSMNWSDFLTMKIAEHNQMQEFNVYEGEKKVGVTKAKTQEEAVKKFAPFFKKDLLTARRVSTMKLN